MTAIEDEQARCARLDPETADLAFFGVTYVNGSQRLTPDLIEFARHVCAGCSLRDPCLQEALSTPERHDQRGIRAGTLPEERKALRLTYKVTFKDDGTEWTGGPVDGRRRTR